MRVGLLSGITLASFIVIAGGAARSQTPVDDLAKPLDWPMLGGENVQASLRTAWKDGNLKYLVTIYDPKGRVNAYLTKYKGLASFSFSFADEDGFRLYTLHIADSSLTKLTDTSSFESAEQSPCTEKLYRSLLQSWRAAISPANAGKPSTHGFTYPGELDVPAASKR